MKLLLWLLSFLFPLAGLIPRARRLGTISFTEVAGVGWQATIRPPLSAKRERGAINAWSGQGSSLSAALREAMALASEHPREDFEGDPRHAPKLGGREFDPE